MKKECLIYGLFMFIFCITNSFSENLNGSQEKGFLNKIELLKLTPP